MAEIKKPQVSHVSGFVKTTPNNDGSTTFRVGSKVGGQRFTLSSGNPFFQKLSGAQRVLVRFLADGKNPTILLVLEEPTGRLIAQYNMGIA